MPARRASRALLLLMLVLLANLAGAVACAFAHERDDLPSASAFAMPAEAEDDDPRDGCCFGDDVAVAANRAALVPPHLAAAERALPRPAVTSLGSIPEYHPPRSI